jgi:hypothetical protein
MTALALEISRRRTSTVSIVTGRKRGLDVNTVDTVQKKERPHHISVVGPASSRISARRKNAPLTWFMHPYQDASSPSDNDS